MMWLPDMRRYLDSRQDQIGPGRLVLVVGPSGAGKDTLIRGAGSACAHDASVFFPRRVITRRSTADEDHDTLREEAFSHAVAAGAFALWWEAHGHRYGVPKSIDDAIRSGRTVVCNVSRTIVETARRRYRSVVVVLVTAPTSVLAERLKSRDRNSDGPLIDRMARNAASGEVKADVVIHNVGRPQAGIRRLMSVIPTPESS